MVGALANGKAGLADFPRVRGKHIHARDGTRRHDKTAPPRRPTPARNPSSRNCTRPNATSRRPTIHEPIIHTNISPRQRGTPPRQQAASARSRLPSLIKRPAAQRALRAVRRGKNLMVKPRCNTGRWPRGGRPPCGSRSESRPADDSRPYLPTLCSVSWPPM